MMATKTSKLTVIKRIAIVGISIAVGVAVVVGFISSKQPPERVSYVETSRSVRVIEAKLQPFTIEVSGFGSAAPDQSWTAISNVKGRVVFRHVDLESGATLPEGTLLLEIDASFYKQALTEANAEIASIDAEIAQLRQEAENTVAMLDLEQQRLELAESDLERTRALVSSNAVPQSNLDTQLRATLQQRQAVQSFLNQQNILPIQLDRLNAQKDRALSKQAQVQSDIDDTKVYAPFDMRISEVKIEMHQYINPGQVLFSGDGIAASEVVIQVPIQSLRRIISEVSIQGEALNINALSAHVQLVGENQQWDAKVIRIANGIDPATRTVRVVLSIPQPTEAVDPISNPPLPKGMYVKGILQTPANASLIVIPQEAVHEGWVYLVNAESRLERRKVEIAFQQDGMAIVASGINAGESIILDDIVPAISGALLSPQQDLLAEQMLATKAAGNDK